MGTSGRAGWALGIVCIFAALSVGCSSGGVGDTADAGGSGGVTGATGTGGGAGAAGTVCGGFAGVACSALEWCDFPGDTCGVADQQGHCRLADGTGCDNTTPVCGCDGRSYASQCSAGFRGVDTVSSRSCIPGNGGAGAPCGVDGDCRTGFKCCSSGGALGSPLECFAVAAGGACPAFP